MPRSPIRIIRGIRREIGARTYDAFARYTPDSDAQLTQDVHTYWDTTASATAPKTEGSHWQGHGSWNDEFWNEYGQLHLAMIEDAREMSGRSSRIDTVVEWGSGGGANMAVIGPAVGKYFGVDISSGNLEECVRQSTVRGLDNFQPIHIPVDNPEEAVQKITGAEGGSTVDCFLATAVYQHLPGRQYARRVTDVAMRLLKEDGIAVINIRYWDLPRQSRIFRRSYLDNGHAFNKYTVYEFEVEMVAAGFEIMEIRMRPLTHHAYFFLRKRLDLSSKDRT